MAQNQLFALDWLARRHPLTVAPQMPLMDAIKLMSRDWDSSCRLSCGLNQSEQDAEADFISSTQESCVLAVANSRLQGIFTEQDLIELIASGRNLNGLRLSDVVNRDVITVKKTQLQDVSEAIAILYKHDVNCLPVTDQEKQFLGLITQDSLYQALIGANCPSWERVIEVMADCPLYAPPDASVLQIAQLMCEYRVDFIPIAGVDGWSQLKPLGVIRATDIIQLWLLELNLKQLQAQAAISSSPLLVKPDDYLFEVQQQMQQHQVRQVLVAGKKGELVGLITQRDLLPTLTSVDWWDIEMSRGQMHQPETKRLKFLEKRISRLQQQLQEQAIALDEQAEQERIVASVALKIRQSLNLEAVLSATVNQVQQLLQSDRVLIYRFNADGGGIVSTEALSNSQWSILDQVIEDPCFSEELQQRYRQGNVHIINDISQSQLDPCYLKMLSGFNVKANLAIPIIIKDHVNREDWGEVPAQSERLWGFVSAHHCSAARTWQNTEINLLRQLSTQVAIAIQQAELYEYSQTQLAQCQQAEAKIYEQAALIDVATDAILVRNLDNQILFWNRGAEKLYGWSLAEAQGKSSQLLLKASSSEIEQATKTAIEQGEWRGELHKVTKSGRTIVVESHWTLMRDSTGKPRSILTVDSDITEKKQLEAQFLRTQRLESIGSLAGGVAHDLNNILTPIMMSVQLLPHTLPSIDSRSRDIMKMLDNNVQRGAALVQQVLSFSRGVEGEHKLLQVKHLLFELKQLIAETFPKSIELEIDIPKNLWTVMGDATQIHQIFLNLVINARDAMPDGGSLGITAENIRLNPSNAEIHNVPAESYIVVTVADTGIGMSAETIDRIFEPFFTTKKLEQGTGLGLATVDNLVKSHGGFVDVSSRVAEGTQFQVFFPAKEIDETETTEISRELPQGSQELILEIDDEMTICEITKASLEVHNYRVITAYDGVEAIALYVQQPVDLVIVNMMMPMMNGITTIRTLQKINPQVKIIGVSGLSSNRQLLEAQQIKINAFLAKPYTTETLLKTLYQVLNP